MIILHKIPIQMRKLFALLLIALTSCGKYITTVQKVTVTEIQHNDDTTGLVKLKPVGERKPFNVNLFKIGDTLTFFSKSKRLYC